MKDSSGVWTSTVYFVNTSGGSVVTPTTVIPTVPAVSDYCADAVVTGLTTSEGSNSDAIKLDWDSIRCGDDTKTYSVYVDSSTKLLVNNLTSSEYKHTGLSSGKTKTYCVSVCTMEGSTKVCSVPASATGWTQ